MMDENLTLEINYKNIRDIIYEYLDLIDNKEIKEKFENEELSAINSILNSVILADINLSEEQADYYLPNVLNFYFHENKIPLGIIKLNLEKFNEIPRIYKSELIKLDNNLRPIKVNKKKE